MVVVMAINLNFSSKNNDLSDILLLNVEALANGESQDDGPYKSFPCNKPGAGSQCAPYNMTAPSCSQLYTC